MACMILLLYSASRQESNFFEFELKCLFCSILVDESWYTLCMTVLECVNQFMGYIMDSCPFYGFRSDSGLRNTFGIEKNYCLS